MTIAILHDWDILERKSKSSSSTVFLVYRVIQRQGFTPETEYMSNHGTKSSTLRRRPSVFRSREAAEKAIAKAACKCRHNRYGDLRVKIATAGAPPHSDYWHQALHEAEQAVAAAFQADIDEVLAAGGLMANTMFNLAQQTHKFDAYHCKLFKSMQVKWDAAREALRSALAGEAKA